MHVEKSFTIIGYRDWKHASGKGGGLAKHIYAAYHSDAIVAWGECKKMTDLDTSVRQLIDSFKKKFKENRHFVKPLG